MKVKSVLLILVMLLSVSLVSCLDFISGNQGAQGNGDGECDDHTDKDNDDVCDVCGEAVDGDEEPCVEHKDSDLDGKCDNCKSEVELEYDGTLVLVDNGAPTFQFVTSNNMGGSNRYSLAQLANKINDCLKGGSVAVVGEQSGTQKPIEILVGGVTTRGARYVKNAHSLGYEGYIIEIIGSKIVVVGGSDAALGKAIGALEERVFGIDDTQNVINNLKMTESINAAQTEFQVENFIIAGNSVEDYVIVTDTKNYYTSSVTKTAQDAIYQKTGKYLEIIDKSQLAPDTLAISFEIVPIGSLESDDGGFSVYVKENGNLAVETEFPNKYASCVELFLSEIFEGADANGKKIVMNVGTVKTCDVRNICYADFGAVGDGITDDSEAIRLTHEYANLWGHRVIAEAGKTYRIGKISESIIVQTDTDWNGATIVFDDSSIDWNDTQARSVWVFKVTSSSSINGKKVTVPSGMTLSKGQTNVGLTFDSPCMLKIENSDENQRIYIRYGTNANSGDTIREYILVDENGNVDPSTPITYNYDAVTSIVRYSISDRPIFIGNGTVKTIAPNPKASDPSYENNYCYFNRGIHVSRSNTTLHDINYIVEGEDMTVRIDRNGDGNIDFWGDDKSYGVPYRGTFNFNECYNTRFIDSVVEGHQAYSFWQISNGKEARNEMGSYAITANSCIGLTMSGLVQYENESTGELITNRDMYHGVMSSNYCRNMVVTESYLDRFDAHKGLYNATLTNSTFGFGILVIGGGQLYIENVTRLSGDPFVMLRNDYNSIFDGDVVIKNCVAGSAIKSVFAGNWVKHDAGLPNYMVRNVLIDGLLAESNTLYIFNIKNASEAALTDSVNPLYLPDSIVVSNIFGSDGKTEITPVVSKNQDAFAGLEIEYK